MLKIDKEKYETDPEYRAKIDAQKEAERAYKREWARKHGKGKVKEPKAEVKVEEEPKAVFRRVICLGCVPNRACALYIPTEAEIGESVRIHCPCDGEEAEGTVTRERAELGV